MLPPPQAAAPPVLLTSACLSVPSKPKPQRLRMKTRQLFTFCAGGCHSNRGRKHDWKGNGAVGQRLDGEKPRQSPKVRLPVDSSSTTSSLSTWLP